jgi:large subunit ribosomal protein L22
MEVRAIAKSVKIGPRKIRLIADAVRHRSIDDALAILEATEKRAALPLLKTLKSAVANAVNNARLDKNSLIIESININDGTALRRFRPSTRGRIHPYKRRSTNIRIVLKEKVKAVAKTAEEKKDKKVENKKGEKADPKK